MILTPVGLFYGEDIDPAIEREIATKRQTCGRSGKNYQRKYFGQHRILRTYRILQLKAQIAYGKELIAHTAKYLGPKGMVCRSAMV